MLKVDQLIVALREAEQPCRRLDALATGYVFAPEEWMLEGEEGLDGWGIECKARGSSKPKLWMCAEDVGYLTRYIDSATEFVQAARPQDAAAITASALMKFVQDSKTPADMRLYVQQIACRVIAELLERIERDREVPSRDLAPISDRLAQRRQAG